MGTKTGTLSSSCSHYPVARTQNNTCHQLLWLWRISRSILFFFFFSPVFLCVYLCLCVRYCLSHWCTAFVMSTCPLTPTCQVLNKVIFWQLTIPPAQDQFTLTGKKKLLRLSSVWRRWPELYVYQPKSKSRNPFGEWIPPPPHPPQIVKPSLGSGSPIIT